jgi:hypothetical protein
MSAAGGKKRPADEPAKDWERTLEPVRKLAAKIKEVLPPLPSLPDDIPISGDAPREALRVISPATRRRAGLDRPVPGGCAVPQLARKQRNAGGFLSLCFSPPRVQKCLR